MRLVYYAFDLLHLDGRDTASLPLIERKALLEPLIAETPGLQFNGHETGDGELIRKHACKLGFEGVVSKTIDAPYAPGNRGLWRKSKCLNRQEFVVVGWTDPEGSRPYLGALLLGYYTDDGKLACPSHRRQCGLRRLRMFVIGAPPNCGGPGIPQRAMTSSRSPSGPRRMIGASWSGKIAGNGGRFPVRSCFALNRSRMAT